MNSDTDALVGAAARAVGEFLPHYAQVIVRVDIDQQRVIMDAQLTELANRQIIPLPLVDELRAFVSGKPEGSPPVNGGRKVLGPLVVDDVIRTAVLAGETSLSPVPVGDEAIPASFLGMLWDGLCTIGGALLGEALGGPAGAAAGAYAGHLFAQEYPPSTWFE